MVKEAGTFRQKYFLHLVLSSFGSDTGKDDLQRRYAGDSTQTSNERNSSDVICLGTPQGVFIRPGSHYESFQHKMLSRFLMTR